MSILESLKNNAEDGVDISKKYMDASYEYSKLKTFKVLTYSLSTVSKLFLIGTLVSMGFIFISVAGAIALGQYLNNLYLGYLYVGLCLLFLGFILYLLRKLIDRKIISKMSHHFFNSKK